MADLGSVWGWLLMTNAGCGSSWEGIEGESQRVVGDGNFLECPVSCPGWIPEEEVGGSESAQWRGPEERLLLAAELECVQWQLVGWVPWSMSGIF